MTQSGRNCSCRSSNQRHLATFADHRVSNSEVDGRHVCHSNLNLTLCIATRGCLVDCDFISSVFGHSSGKDSLGSTRDFRTIRLPNVGQVVGVVISNVGRECNFTRRAYHCVSSCNNNLDGSRIANIHIERIADAGATADTVDGFHREDVRVLAAVIMFVQCIVLFGRNISIGKHPLVSISSRANRIVHVSHQHNIVAIADDRITRDCNSVVRVNGNDRVNRGLDTARHFRNIDQRIVVSGHIAIHGQRRIRNRIQGGARNHLAISIPCIGSAASNICREGDFTASADNITRREGELDGVKRDNCNRIITHSLAL